MNDYWKKYFGWSSSRQRNWDTCKLRYYFAYIGKWEGFRGNRDRDKLQWLSHMTPWFMLKGSLVHEAIESQINQWAIGRPVSKDAAISIFKYKLNEVRSSPLKFLIDNVNGSPITAEEFDSSLEDGSSLLDSFFSMIWPNYASLKYVKHEEFDSFEVDKCKVWTKIDLVTKMENGTIVITDWKTGKIGANSDENEAQIGAYVLWALDKLKVGEDSVKTEIAYLRDPAYRRKLTVVTKEQLAGVKKQIIECSRSMLAVNSVSDFPANPSARVCRDCPFATVCEEGVQHIPEDVREQPVSLHDKSIKSNSP